MENKLFIKQSQRHDFQCSGDASLQGISSNIIDLAISEYSGFSTKRVKAVDPSATGNTK